MSMLFEKISKNQKQCSKITLASPINRSVYLITAIYEKYKLKNI